MSEREPGRNETRNDTGSGGSPPRKPIPGDEALFSGEPDRRLFGEGSYAEGGSNQEGNYEEREVDPQGSSGSFDDAGGHGGTELLGEGGLDGAGEAQRRNREASERKRGSDESIDRG